MRSAFASGAAFVYARLGCELMGCKSPLGESPNLPIGKCETTSVRQGHRREALSEGSRVLNEYNSKATSR